ncbi:MAG: hypothetical protein EPO06_07315 [Burkholderiaceae bacterium]|nr:MAG: hypothetical protein EPO06_07315 [Burkholderiaceae bacterium]
MSILRLALVLLVLAGVYLWLRKLSRDLEQSRPTPPEKTSATEAMIQCRQCGVHVPQSEVVFAEGYTFCSTAHRDQYLQRPSTS